MRIIRKNVMLSFRISEVKADEFRKAATLAGESLTDFLTRAAEHYFLLVERRTRKRKTLRTCPGDIHPNQTEAG